MLTRLIAATTTAPAFDKEAFTEFLITAAANQPPSAIDIMMDIAAVLDVILFIAELAIMGVLIFKCRKFMDTRQQPDYEGIPRIAKVLEILLIFLAIGAVRTLIFMPISFSMIEEAGKATDFSEYGLTVSEEFQQAFNEVLQQQKQDAITQSIAGVAINIGLFVLGVIAWRYFQKAKKIYAYNFPLGGIHRNPNAPAVPSPNAVLPTDDELFGSSAASTINGSGADEAKMKELFGEDQGESKAVSVTPKKEDNKPRSDEDIFGNNNNSIFSGEKNKEDNMGLFGNKKQQPVQPVQPVKRETKTDEDIFGGGSSFMQGDDSELEKMRSMLLQDTATPAPREEAKPQSDDIFGTESSSSWGMVADENDPLLASLLVNDEKKAPAEELKNDDIFGSNNTSTWGAAADESLLEGIVVNDKKEDIKLDNSDVFGQGNNSGWGSFTDENDPLLKGLIAEEGKKEEKYNPGDVFGEESNSSWGKLADTNDPLLKGLIAEDEKKEEAYKADSIFGNANDK